MQKKKKKLKVIYFLLPKHCTAICSICGQQVSNICHTLTDKN